MISTSDFKKGARFEEDNAPWQVMEHSVHNPSARGAATLVKVKARNLKTGQVLQKSYKSGEMFPEPDLNRLNVSFLYEEGEDMVFMDTETYEQIELPAELLGDRRPFLQDGMTIVVEFYEAEALNATVPQKVTCKVVETEPVVKGQTAANSFKPAILDNGVKVMVPPFVGQDEDIIVNTETMEYSERA